MSTNARSGLRSGANYQTPSPPGPLGTKKAKKRGRDARTGPQRFRGGTNPGNVRQQVEFDDEEAQEIEAPCPSPEPPRRSGANPPPNVDRNARGAFQRARSEPRPDDSEHREDS